MGLAASALPLHGISIIGALLELLKGGCYGQGGGGGFKRMGGGMGWREGWDGRKSGEEGGGVFVLDDGVKGSGFIEVRVRRRV